MTDLDRASLDRILPSTPGPASWDDVMSRSRARHGHRRRRLVVLTAAALVVLGATSALAMRAFVLDKGLVGLPPIGATPSAPEKGVLDMYYWLHPGVAGQNARPGGQTWVYADGRLIRLLYGGSHLREAANRWSSGFLEQRLTTKGVELLRSEIVSTGLFGHEHPCMNFIQLLHGGQRVAPIPNKGRFCSKDGTPIAATPQLESALGSLVGRLANPGSWLPPSAWKQRKIRAYVPSRFAVCASVIESDTLREMGPARIVALLPAAAQNALRGRDWNATGADPGCFAVTTKGARSLAKALDDAGPAKKGGAYHLNYRFDAPGPSRQVWITFEPYLPHGEITCSACG